MALRVVASPVDALANALCDLAARTGWDVVRLNHAEAALSTTVEVDNDTVKVWPDTALFLRPPLESPPDDPDSRFLHGERLALLWAAAALTERRVLNRPTRNGLWGRGSVSARVTEHRANLPRERPEIFCSDSGRRDWPGAWAAESCDGAVGRWPAPGLGPARARPITEGERYEAVIVVGVRAWRRSDEPLSHLPLLECSRTAVERMALDFGVVWWAIPPSMDRAALVRIVPAPTLFDIAPRWPEVGPALLALLS